jgi:hypothetical protein
MLLQHCPRLKKRQQFMFSPSILRIVFLVCVVCAGAIQLWAFRFETYSGDAIVYLDLADKFRQGLWLQGISPYWSPLYPLLIAAVFSILNPSAQWEFLALKCINLALLICLTVSFEFFLSSLLRYYRSSNLPEGTLAIDELSWRAVVYTLFLYGTFVLGGVYQETPDYLLFVFVYLCSAAVLKIALEPSKLFGYLTIGVSSGLGFLAKAFMLPLSIIYMVMAGMLARRCASSARNIALMLLCWSIAAAPLLVHMGFSEGRITISKSGALNYAWYVSSQFPPVSPPSAESDLREALHPIQEIIATPKTYVFDRPFPVTYSPWYEPHYWMEGVTVRLDPFRSFLGALFNTRFYLGLFAGWLLATWVLLAVLAKNRGVTRQSLQHTIIIWLPGITACLLYGLVTNFFLGPWGERHFGPFIVLIYCGLMASLRLPDNERSRKALLLAGVFTLVVYGVAFGARLAHDLQMLSRPNQDIHMRIADALHDRGLREGDKVALIGRQEHYDWARVGRFQIIAEVDDIRDYWKATPDQRQNVIDAFKKLGAKAVLYFPGQSTEMSKLESNFRQRNLAEIGVIMKLVGLPAPEASAIIGPPDPGSGWQRLTPSLDCSVIVFPSRPR